MAVFTIAKTTSVNKTYKYLLTNLDAASRDIDISKLNADGDFDAVETITLTSLQDDYYYTFASDGVYKLYYDVDNYLIVSVDSGVQECLKNICMKVICGTDPCTIANFNSMMLLAQTYWSLLATQYQGLYNFNTSNEVDMVVISNIETVLTALETRCALEEEEDCGCS